MTRRGAWWLTAVVLAAGLAPAGANPRAGTIIRANASVLFRGTDAEAYSIDIVAEAYDAADLGRMVTRRISVRIGVCGEHCIGPTYGADLPATARFARGAVTVSTTFAGVPLVVSWTARTPPPAAASGAPTVDTSDGVAVELERLSVLAPASVRLADVSCPMRSARILTRRGVELRLSATDGDAPPSRLPRGFFTRGTRRPRCI